MKREIFHGRTSAPEKGEPEKSVPPVEPEKPKEGSEPIDISPEARKIREEKEAELKKREIREKVPKGNPTKVLNRVKVGDKIRFCWEEQPGFIEAEVVMWEQMDTDTRTLTVKQLEGAREIKIIFEKKPDGRYTPRNVEAAEKMEG